MTAPDTSPDHATAIDKTYDPASIEARIGARWEDAGAFKAGAGAKPGAEPFSIVIPPPNVTGSLHMGHALNNTLQDVLARFERMRGRDVLWQPGTDHAGIATQMVVERKLAADGKPGRRELGREKFLEEVWAWKAESGGRIAEQLKRLGASCDFTRERFTMDAGLSDAVTKVFVALHRDGLIYRDKRLVNWDPAFQTAISDLEVVQVEKRGKFTWSRTDGEPLDTEALNKLLDRDPHGHFYYFNYPVKGAAYDADNPDTFIQVATTRPETMLGDTAVAVHPENETLGGFIGKTLILPLVGREIPVVGDDYADPEKGTGAVKITPAHDFNDFEVGKRHAGKLADPINIFDVEGRVSLADLGALNQVVSSLNGLDRFEARKRIVELMAEEGFLAKIEPTTMTVPHGDRSNAVIEPYLTDQWFVDAKTLAGPAMDAVRDGRTRFVPKNWEKTYFQWLENIEPWCISRQLWWGHQIPAWYGPDGQVFVAETEFSAHGMAEMHYGSPVTLIRDEDVLDTWFSSALWPFSTMGWPEETAELKRYYPTSVLITGFDIIFFWIARMMMMGLHFRSEIPFHDVYIHALVRDEKGAKMSKSKGNVIDPLDLIDQYGADALRFTLAAMAAQGRDIRLATSRVEGYRNFATKLWNATRFAQMNGCAEGDTFDPASARETLNRWIVGETMKAADEITAALEAYRFNDAAAAAYRFVWNIFCDWYLELAKPALQSDEDTPAKAETRKAVAWVLDRAFALLHPFMPFITEELWALTASSAGRATLLAHAPWPVGEARVDPAAEAEIGWLIDLVTEVRSVRAEMNLAAGAQIPLVLVNPSTDVRGYAVRYDAMARRLVRLSEIAVADSAPAGSVLLVVRGESVALPLVGVIDLDAERARLTKEITKLDGEITRISSKLSNERFVASAPEEVVEGEREKQAEFETRRSKLTAALTRLEGLG